MIDELKALRVEVASLTSERDAAQEALAAANARADGFKSALELASKAGEQTQRELEEALAAANEELAKYHARPYATLAADLRAAEAALAAARRECEGLRAALKQRGTHRDGCASYKQLGRIGSRSGSLWQGGDAKTCSCELGAALAAPADGEEGKHG